MPIGTAALGIGTGIAEQAVNQVFGEMNQRRELRGQKKALKQQNDAAMDIWERTNYKAQVEQLNKAGLNPGLIYGMGGAGGTVGGSSATAKGDQGNSSMDIGQAVQLGLMKAQKENIEASTENTKVDTAKKAGVDTDLNRAQEGTEYSKQKLMAVDTKIREIEQNVKDSTQWYDIGKAGEEWRKLAGEAVSASAKADVDRNTIETDIKQRQADLALTLIEQRAKEAGIKLTYKQMYAIDGQVKAAFMNADAGYWQAETGAKQANTAADKQSWDRHINDIAESTKLSVDVVKGIIQALALKGLLGGRTVIEGFKQRY